LVKISPSSEIIKPVPPPTSCFWTPFCLYWGILNSKNGWPKNCSNSLNGEKLYSSKTGRFLVIIIETTAGEASFTTFITASY
jgi:hypothetical protein